jgi:ABC-type dipeptide/oligopeptide/nickel transport system permease component
MTRLRPPPSKLPFRVMIVCLGVAWILLWRGGGSMAEAGALAITALPLEPDGLSTFRALLGKATASFFLISLAMATGLSLALALSMAASSLGGSAARFGGWMGRMLAGVPPMGWALGAIVWLIQIRGLPVETLFPYVPSAESDSVMLQAGRTLWAWAVPVAVLAIPILGTGLFSLTHKLTWLLHEPLVDRLKARGLPHSSILYRHLVPILRVQLARIARPCAALLLGFDVPVEELLGFDGWGKFAADLLLSPSASGPALSAVFWSGALLLTAILGWLSLLDRQGLPLEAEQEFNPAERRSMRSAWCGAVLILTLMLPLRWFVPENFRARIEPALAAQSFEILRALGVSLAALALVMAASALMSLSRSRLLGRGWVATLALAPLLVVLLFWEKEAGRQDLTIVLVVALPGIAVCREVLGDADDSNFIDASRAMGRRPLGIWWHHVLPGVLSSLPGLALRRAGTVMMMFCVLDFYAAPSSATWGGQMRLQADRVLDDPLPALAPAALLTLLGLSFRLLSRAFAEGPPTSGAPSSLS